MIAFHYPPMGGSSGLQRALKFSDYLREHGWQPHVLTVRDWVYENTRPEQLADIPEDVEVTRALAFDARRHFSILGRYPGFLALPDRWSSWRVDGVRRGGALIRKHHFDAIWSTFPISTAHSIGHVLARRSGLPWVADLRDSMTEPGYPSDPAVFKAVRSVEARTVAAASAVTFTAPSAVAMYEQRYPDIPAGRFQLIENGFDEPSFAGLESAWDPGSDGPVTLLHSGVVYPNERDPRPFFDALSALKKEGLADAARLRVVLRATGHDELMRREIAARDIADIVRLEPGIAYRDALREMMSVDGLLVLQAANCNHKIPAKVYEYFRAGRPIVALTDGAGDTARLLRDNGHELVAQLDDAAPIRDVLLEAMRTFRRRPTASAADAIARYSRRAQSGRLAELLDGLTKGQHGGGGREDVPEESQRG